MDQFKERTGLYHEQQISALCGQHSINNLLQGDIYSVGNLADIARELDTAERNVLTNSPCCPENMDATGFFSIQVLQQALKGLQIELVPFASQEEVANQARKDPLSIRAYICNLGLHWFTLRQCGGQFFEFNSLYCVPKFLNNRSVRHYLNMLQDDGYSVFVVSGELPHCPADEKLTKNPIDQIEYELLTKDIQGIIMDGKVFKDDEALALSKKLLISLPPDLREAYMKNPKDPRIQEQIMKRIPPDMLKKLRIVRVVVPESNLDDVEADEDEYENLIKYSCDCPHHRAMRENQSNAKTGSKSTNTQSNEGLIEPSKNQHVVTERVVTYSIRQPGESSKQDTYQVQYIETTTVVGYGPGKSNSLLDDDEFSRSNLIQDISSRNINNNAIPNREPVKALPSASNSSSNLLSSTTENNSTKSSELDMETASTTGVVNNDSTEQAASDAQSTEMVSSHLPRSESSSTTNSPMDRVETDSSAPSSLFDSKAKPPITSRNVPLMDTDPYILDMVITESLRTAQSPGSESDPSVYESLMEAYNQQCLEAALAASLGVDDRVERPRRPNSRRQPIDDPNERMLRYGMAESLRTAQQTNTGMNDSLNNHESEAFTGANFGVPNHRLPGMDNSVDPLSRFPALNPTTTNTSLPMGGWNDPSSYRHMTQSRFTDQNWTTDMRNPSNQYGVNSVPPQNSTITDTVNLPANDFLHKSTGEFSESNPLSTNDFQNPYDMTNNLSKYGMDGSASAAQQMTTITNNAQIRNETNPSAKQEISTSDAARALSDYFTKKPITSISPSNQTATRTVLSPRSTNDMDESVMANLKTNTHTDNAFTENETKIPIKEDINITDDLILKKPDELISPSNQTITNTTLNLSNSSVMDRFSNISTQPNTRINDTLSQNERKTPSGQDLSASDAAEILSRVFKKGFPMELLTRNRQTTNIRPPNVLPNENANSGAVGFTLSQSTESVLLNKHSSSESFEKPPVSILSTRKNSSGILNNASSLTESSDSLRSHKKVTFALDSADLESVLLEQLESASPVKPEIVPPPKPEITSVERTAATASVKPETVALKPSEIALPVQPESPSVERLASILPVKSETVAPMPQEIVLPAKPANTSIERPVATSAVDSKSAAPIRTEIASSIHSNATGEMSVEGKLFLITLDFALELCSQFKNLLFHAIGCQ